VFATIRIALNESDYSKIIQAENLDSDDYYECTMYFDSGAVQETISKVGIRLKGASTRLQQKHGWTLKFNEFVSGQKFYDMKKIGLKPGSSQDDGIAKQVLFVDFMRAVGVPSQRTSFALLYINDLFHGIYVMQEDIGPDFFDMRLHGENGEGNTMKFFWNVHNQYFGDDASVYQSMVHINALGDPWYYYEQSDGDGNWSDYISLLRFLNQSSDEEFDGHLEDHVEVDSLLKAMVVESFMLAGDNLRSGNNFYFYHMSEPEQQWQFVEFDFDECLVFDEHGEPEDSDYNIFTFFDNSGTEDEDPLTVRMMRISQYNSTFQEHYEVFLEGVFGSSSPQQPADRYAAIFQFVLPWISKDYMFQMALGIDVDTFILAGEATIQNLPKRYQNVTYQLEEAK
jgi:spore coat protein CotH